jgi:hypothetical protein
MKARTQPASVCPGHHHRVRMPLRPSMSQSFKIASRKGATVDAIPCFGEIAMSRWIAWSVFILGVAHVMFGMLRFRGPLLDAVMAGFSGQFAAPEIRRTAFWFLLIGPMLMLVGQLAVRAVDHGDLGALRLIGLYMLCAGVIGVAAFPRSPLWALVLLSLPMLAVGVGLVR